MSQTERTDYLPGLRSVFGERILADASGLQASHQRRCERLRHQLNARWRSGAGEFDESPGRLLISVTQQCTFRCPHCWVFGSPGARCGLSLDELEAIHRNTSTRSSPTWTISGGELFCLPYFAEVLRRYPVDCVFTNGFWGHPAERCRAFLEEIAAALGANRHLASREMTFILSYDTFHVRGSGRDYPLAAAIARIIEGLYRLQPRVAIRLSHAQCRPGDTGYCEVFDLLERDGFSVTRTERNDGNGNIDTISFRCCGSEGEAKEIFVDTYPVTPVCRALLQGEVTDGLSGRNVGNRDPASWRAHHRFRPRARYRYAIGPDGGMGLYQILYAPPVPYWLGDPILESWEVIARRASCDPIAISLRDHGVEPVLSFLEACGPPLLEPIRAGSRTIQQLLYLVLLDPQRRLLLNLYLLRHLHQQGRLACADLDLLDRIGAVLDSDEGEFRSRALREIYGMAQESS